MPATELFFEATEQPPTPDSLAVLPCLLKANWSSGLSVKSSFSTSVESTLTASEQRWGSQGSPRRIQTVNFLASTLEELVSIRTMSRRMSKSRFMFPLYSDQGRVSTTANAGDSVIPLYTPLLRIFPGYRIVIARPSTELQYQTYNIRKVTAVNENSVEIDAPLDHNFQTGSVVFPIMECLLAYSSKIPVVTDGVVNVSVEVVEAPGKGQLPVKEDLGVIPAGIGNFGSFPILPPYHDYSESNTVGISLTGDFSQSGLDSVPTIYGDRAKESLSFGMKMLSRYDAMTMIRFFESRGGSLYPFFVISPLTEYQLLSIIGETVTVRAVGLEQDWSDRTYMAFEDIAGVRYVRAIAFQSRAGDIDTVALSHDLPGLNPLNVVRCTAAWLCRFSQDELAESWVTTEVMRASLTIEEVVEEGPVEIDNLSILTSTSLTTDAGVNCGAATTYYQAVNCLGELQDLWVENLGQTLPWEFINAEDQQCYRIPVDAIPQALGGTLALTIEQGKCCTAQGDEDCIECGTEGRKRWERWKSVVTCGSGGKEYETSFVDAACLSQGDDGVYVPWNGTVNPGTNDIAWRLWSCTQSTAIYYCAVERGECPGELGENGNSIPDATPAGDPPDDPEDTCLINCNEPMRDDCCEYSGIDPDTSDNVVIATLSPEAKLTISVSQITKTVEMNGDHRATLSPETAFETWPESTGGNKNYTEWSMSSVGMEQSTSICGSWTKTGSTTLYKYWNPDTNQMVSLDNTNDTHTARVYVENNYANVARYPYFTYTFGASTSNGDHVDGYGNSSTHPMNNSVGLGSDNTAGKHTDSRTANICTPASGVSYRVDRDSFSGGKTIVKISKRTYSANVTNNDGCECVKNTEENPLP